MLITPCTKGNPMEADASPDNPIDLAAALRALAFPAEPAAGTLYVPPLPDHTQTRDVRKEYRDGRFGWEQSHYRGIELAWAACHFGGVRPWYRCPGCGYHCALLFHNVCRRCAGLRYQSEYDTRLDRLRARARMVRRKLGDTSGMFSLVPGRPKKMRHATFEKLLAELEAIEIEAIAVLAPELTGMPAVMQHHFYIVREINAMRRRRGW